MQNLEMTNIMNNAVHVGKFDQVTADTLLSLAKDDESTEALKSIVATTDINPNKLKGIYHPALIKQATKSYNDIEKQAGGFNDMKKLAPELYKAKFFEKNRRMPAVI